MQTITPQQLQDLTLDGRSLDLIDVRSPAEFREVHVAFARNVPLDRLDPRIVQAGRAADAKEPLYVICRSGSRGKQACEKFLAAGMTSVVNVDGGHSSQTR